MTDIESDLEKLQLVCDFCLFFNILYFEISRKIQVLPKVKSFLLGPGSVTWLGLLKCYSYVFTL